MRSECGGCHWSATPLQDSHGEDTEAQRDDVRNLPQLLLGLALAALVDFNTVYQHSSFCLPGSSKMGSAVIVPPLPEHL